MCVPPLHLPSQAGLTPRAQLLRKLEAHRSNADLLHLGGAKATAGSLQGSCDGFATEEGLLCDFTPLSHLLMHLHVALVLGAFLSL